MAKQIKKSFSDNKVSHDLVVRDDIMPANIFNSLSHNIVGGDMIVIFGNNNRVEFDERKIREAVEKFGIDENTVNNIKKTLEQQSVLITDILHEIEKLKQNEAERQKEADKLDELDKKVEAVIENIQTIFSIINERREKENNSYQEAAQSVNVDINDKIDELLREIDELKEKIAQAENKDDTTYIYPDKVEIVGPKPTILHKVKKIVCTKKFIIVAACVLLAVFLAVGTPLLVNYVSEKDLQYSSVNGGYSVYGGKYFAEEVGSTLTIPDTYKDKPIVEIAANGFSNYGGITELVIPATVTRIGADAFSGCKNLKIVTIKVNESGTCDLKTIDSRAFYGCEALIKFDLPNGLEDINDEAFAETALTVAMIPTTVEYVGRNVYAGGSVNKVIIYDRVSAPDTWQPAWIDPAVTVEYRIHIELDLNGGAAEWQNETYAVYNCAYYLPVPERADYTFSGWYCGDDAITSANGASIEPFTYAQPITATANWELKTNTITYHANGGSGTMQPQKMAISTKDNLRENTFTRINHIFLGWATSENGNVVYKDNAEYTMGTDSNYDLYAKWQAATSSTFFDIYESDEISIIKYVGYSSVSEIIIPELINGKHVTSIRNEAFRGLSSLKSIFIPDTVTIIGNHAFYGCSSLASIEIPNRVTSIGSYAFYGCKCFTNVIIPDSVTSIGSNAFSGCSKLMGIEIPNSVTSIGIGVFSDCSSLAVIDVASNNTKYHSYNNCLIETSSKTLIAGSKYSEIPTDGSVTSIGSYAFYGCTGLTSITMPNSVTSIGEYAFRGCSSLTSIDIPNSVTSIGNNAFYSCSKLKIIYRGTKAQWKEIVKGENWNIYAATGSNIGFVTCTDGTLSKSEA